MWNLELKIRNVGMLMNNVTLELEDLYRRLEVSKHHAGIDGGLCDSMKKIIYSHKKGLEMVYHKIVSPEDEQRYEKEGVAWEKVVVKERANIDDYLGKIGERLEDFFKL